MSYAFYKQALHRVAKELATSDEPTVAGVDTAIELAALVLSNLHRIADALERLATAQDGKSG